MNHSRRMRVGAGLLALAMVVGAAYWLTRPAKPPDGDAPAPAEAPAGVVEAPATVEQPPVARRADLVNLIAPIAADLAADERERGRARAQLAVTSGAAVVDWMALLGGPHERTIRDLADGVPAGVDWLALKPAAFETAAVAEVLQFMRHGRAPNAEWNALRQEFKESSQDFAAAIVRRDAEQTQRAARRLQASCTECHRRFQWRPVPHPVSPAPPVPELDLAYKNDPRQDIPAVADMLYRGKYETARAWTDKIAEATDFQDMMSLFKPPKHGGLGVILDSKTRQEAGIESALQNLAQERFWSGDRTPLVRMASQTLAIAEVVRTLPPPRGVDESLWRKRTLEFRLTAQDLIDAAREKEPSFIPRAADRLNNVCTACHAKMIVPAIGDRPRGKSTAELVAMLDGESVDKDKGVNFLSRKRALAIQELGSRKDELTARLGASLVKASRASLADPDLAVRLQLVELIGRFSPEVKELAAVLGELMEQEKDEEVRLAATLALGRLKEGQGVPALLKALADEDPVVRGRAAQALARLGKPAVPGLRKALSAGNRDSRASSLGALGRIGADAQECVPDLLALLKADDPLLQNLAGAALRRIDPAAAEKAGIK